MALVNDGYFSEKTTLLSVYRDAGRSDLVYSVEVSMPPLFRPDQIIWALHFALENVVHRNTTPDLEAAQKEKYWLVYEFGAIKEPPFAAAIFTSYDETLKLLFDGVSLLPREGQETEFEDEEPSLDQWLECDGTTLRIDPTRTGE